MICKNIIAFMAVVEKGSFTAAASNLNSSKARISQQLSELEGQLNCVLIQRSTRKQKLTEEGKRYYEECKRASNILYQAKHNIAETQNHLSGKIKLNSVGGIFAERLLAKALNDFLIEYPEVEVDLALSSNKIDLLSDSFDLVIRMGNLEDSNLIARKLIDIDTHIVTSHKYLPFKLSHPKDLLKHNCIYGSIKKWTFHHKTKPLIEDIVVSGNFRIANGNMMKLAVQAGVGIARMNSLYTKEAIKDGSMIEVFNDWHIPPQPISLLYPNTKYKPKRVQVFIEYLVNWFKEHKNSL